MRYFDRIADRFKRQEQKGISKYGQVLEDNPRGVVEALEYLAEELTDGLMYVEEAIEKARKAEPLNKTNRILSDWDKATNKAAALANNALYFADSSDYVCYLWQILEALSPDVKEIDRDDRQLDYIEEG